MENSLDRLNLDQIDLLYAHGVDSVMPIEEITKNLNDIVDSGHVRYIGVSNWPDWMVVKANEIAHNRGWHQFKAMQYYYSLSERDAEETLILYAESENLAFDEVSAIPARYLFWMGEFQNQNRYPGEVRKMQKWHCIRQEIRGQRFYYLPLKSGCLFSRNELTPSR